MMDTNRRRSLNPFLFFWALLILFGLSTRTLQAQCPTGEFCCPPRTDGCPGGVGCEECCTDADCPNDADPCNAPTICGRCGGGTDDFSSPCCEPGTLPPDNTVACASDNIFCNGTELCAGGTCSGHTGNPCTPGECSDACSVDSNATTCNLPGSTSCTDVDGNVCTSSFCNGLGACISNPNDFLCDDLVNCTVNDACAGGACNGTAVQCDDSITCTLDACDETDGSCQFDNGQCECQTDADCNDSNVCTDEFCCTDPKICPPNTIFTCMRSNNSDPCNDDIFCNGTDTCGGGTCSIHTGDPCTGGEQCDETCDEAGDNCFAPVGAACDDDDFLTTTQCDGTGKCTVIAKDNTQGSSFVCSLRPGGDQRWNPGILACALALGAGLLGLRFRKKLR